jgi:hypothetical protein
MTDVFRSMAAPRCRLGPWLAMAAAAALALAGCGAEDGARTQTVAAPVLVDATQARAEYAAQTRRLDLPEGYSWPSSPPLLREDLVPAGHMFERGVGRQEAEFHWYCAWAQFALARPSHRAPAVDALRSFEQMALWTEMDQNGRSLFRGIQDSLERGDPTPLAEYRSDNCG